jgi:hypothetical protein
MEKQNLDLSYKPTILLTFILSKTNVVVCNYQAWQSSGLVFAFLQDYIFYICVSFFISNLELQHSTSALSTTGFFSTFCSKKKKTG